MEKFDFSYEPQCRFRKDKTKTTYNLKTDRICRYLTELELGATAPDPKKTEDNILAEKKRLSSKTRVVFSDVFST